MIYYLYYIDTINKLQYTFCCFRKKVKYFVIAIHHALLVFFFFFCYNTLTY